MNFPGKAIALAACVALALLVSVLVRSAYKPERLRTPGLEISPGHSRALTGSNRPRDVILVTWDTTRADRLSLYGNPRPTTPALGRFAHESVVFEHAYSTSSWTLPAHASMFTGKAPKSHGAHNDPTGTYNLSQQIDDQHFRLLRADGLADGETTLAEVLKDNGYVTGAFVGGPWLAPRFGAMQGFDTVDADVKALGGRPADKVTDAALAWLGNVEQKHPFFLFVNYFDVHWPYEPPKGFAELARGDYPSSKWDAYDGEIRFVDTQFERLLDGLRSQGRYNNSLIVVVADHGDLLGEHGQKGHANWLWEELIHVPLVVHDPLANKTGRRTNELISTMDIPAIIARSLELTLPASFASLSPGKRKEALAEVYRLEFSIRMKGAALDRDLFAVIQWPWKFIVDTRGAEQLFNLDLDPGEQHNLVDSNHAKAIALRTDLENRRAEMTPPLRKPIVVDKSTHDQLRSLGYVQ